MEHPPILQMIHDLNIARLATDSPSIEPDKVISVFPHSMSNFYFCLSQYRRGHWSLNIILTPLVFLKRRVPEESHDGALSKKETPNTSYVSKVYIIEIISYSKSLLIEGMECDLGFILLLKEEETLPSESLSTLVVLSLIVKKIQ